MAPTKQTHVRLSPAILTTLKQLRLATGLDTSNVIRLAIMELAKKVLKG